MIPLGLLRADERAEVIDVKNGSHASGVAAKSCRDHMDHMELRAGESGKIVKMGTIGPLKRRLMDMGVLVGEEVKVEKIAPLGKRFNNLQELHGKDLDNTRRCDKLLNR